jgi:hypothetical protein
MAYPATPKTWVAGDVLTAAQLNAELRDALLATFPLGPPDAAWTSYTPTLTQSGAVTKTVTYAKYTKIGRLVICNVQLVCTGAGTGAAVVAVGLPPYVPVQTGLMPIGTFTIRDISAAASYVAYAAPVTTTTVQGMPSVSTNYLGAQIFTAALASPDEIGLALAYESTT